MADDDTTKEHAAWHNAVADVKPLKSRTVIHKTRYTDTSPAHSAIQELLPRPIDKEEHKAEEVGIGLRSKNGSPQPIDIISNTALCIAGKVAGMDNKLFTRFKRGQLGFERTYDLHGYYEGDAWLAIHNFLHECVSLEMRTVLIIHGKGKGHGPARDMGVIKSQIAQWLCQHPKVLAFHTAQPTDGGRGALYVYLKKR